MLIFQRSIRQVSAVDKDTVVVCTADETPSVTARLHNATAGSYVNYLTYEGL
ncbi:MAG: hypothetical protein II166_06200 [Firmicutes bacterium]|nr:hypothetical protein [Bacillota bacterium]